MMSLLGYYFFNETAMCVSSHELKRADINLQCRQFISCLISCLKQWTMKSGSVSPLLLLHKLCVSYNRHLVINLFILVPLRIQQ